MLLYLRILSLTLLTHCFPAKSSLAVTWFSTHIQNEQGLGICGELFMLGPMPLWMNIVYVNIYSTDTIKQNKYYKLFNRYRVRVCIKAPVASLMYLLSLWPRTRTLPSNIA